MPRLPRLDHPGSWHHVMNRGIARRTVFENRADIRAFLARLAVEVRRGTIEVHAFAIMTTHVHLLVRSPVGQLAVAMKRVFNAYVRHFNRTRRRDGSLFRGRYRSRLVTSVIDRLNVVAYIDHNPVDARLSVRPEDYAYGSARYWAIGRAPPWLATSFVSEALRIEDVGAPGAAEAYRREFAARAGSPLALLIEARMASGAQERDELDDLVAAAPERVHSWMLRRAALADQTVPGLPLVDAEQVLSAWRTAQSRWTRDLKSRRGPGRSTAELARVALLRDLGGMRYASIAEICGTSPTEARHRYRLHADLVNSDVAYGEAFRDTASEALASAHRASPRCPGSATSQF